MTSVSGGSVWSLSSTRKRIVGGTTLPSPGEAAGEGLISPWTVVGSGSGGVGVTGDTFCLSSTMSCSGGDSTWGAFALTRRGGGKGLVAFGVAADLPTAPRRDFVVVEDVPENFMSSEIEMPRSLAMR